MFKICAAQDFFTNGFDGFAWSGSYKSQKKINKSGSEENVQQWQVTAFFPRWARGLVTVRCLAARAGALRSKHQGKTCSVPSGAQSMVGGTLLLAPVPQACAAVGAAFCLGKTEIPAADCYESTVAEAETLVLVSLPNSYQFIFCKGCCGAV